MAENIKSSNDKLYERLFLFSYGSFLTYCLVGHIQAFHTPLQLISNAAIVLLLVGFLLQYRYCSRTEFLTYTILMVLSIVTSIYNNNFAFFKLMLFAGSIRYVSFRKIIRFDLKLRIFLIILVSFLCRVGIAADQVYYYNGIMRRSLGFTNPNALGVAVFILVCDYVYLAGKNIKYKHLVISLLIMIWLFYVARCRTAVAAILILLILAWLYKAIPDIFTLRISETLFYLLPFLFSGLTYWGVTGLLRGDSLAIVINQLMSSRINAIVAFTTQLSPKLFGQPIGETVSRSLDNAYGFAWYDLGILISILLLFSTLKAMKRYFKSGNIMLCIIIAVFLFYGLSEHLWLFVDYNVFMLAWCYNLRIDDEDEVDDYSQSQ